MIFSVHIPKTAGTSFRKALEERYGERLALYYGVQDPKTTPSLRVSREELAGAAAELEARGFEVLHGHYPLRYVKPLVTEPSRQVWVWLRDPVERVLSQFDFYRERPLELKALAGQVKAGEVGLDQFAGFRGVRELQSRYLRDYALSDLAFVGVSEQFELGLALLFGGEAPQLSMRFNATMEKCPADARQRTHIAATNPRDMQLYAEGLRLFVGRVVEAAAIEAPERPTAAGAGLLRRLLAKVA